MAYAIRKIQKVIILKYVEEFLLDFVIFAAVLITKYINSGSCQIALLFFFLITDWLTKVKLNEIAKKISCPVLQIEIKHQFSFRMQINVVRGCLTIMSLKVLFFFYQ